MNLRVYTGITAAIAALIGVIFLFAGVSTSKTGEALDCGSAISSSDQASLEGAGKDIARAMAGLATDYSTLNAAACEDARSSRLGWTLPLAGLGLAVAVGAMIAERRARDKAWAAKKAQADT